MYHYANVSLNFIVTNFIVPFSLLGGQHIPPMGRVQTLTGSQDRTRLVLCILHEKLPNLG